VTQKQNKRKKGRKEGRCDNLEFSFWMTIYSIIDTRRKKSNIFVLVLVLFSSFRYV
jgi:hypothetical protein